MTQSMRGLHQTRWEKTVRNYYQEIDLKVKRKQNCFQIITCGSFPFKREMNEAELSSRHKGSLSLRTEGSVQR